MVARDGVEPPTPAFSAQLLNVYNDLERTDDTEVIEDHLRSRVLWAFLWSGIR
jgi:hypothetical protein